VVFCKLIALFYKYLLLIFYILTDINVSFKIIVKIIETIFF